ncbi:MAG: hypothetical protein ACFIN2_00545 [Candidatus Walczuchella monophlebidarum]
MGNITFKNVPVYIQPVQPVQALGSIGLAQGYGQNKCLLSV